MKKRLNFITALIGVALGIMLMNHTQIAFVDGFKEGLNSSKENEVSLHIETTDLFTLELKPAAELAKPTPLLNVKSGEWMPARIRTVTVEMPPSKKSGWMMVWTFVCAVLFITGVVMCVYNFLKIIFAVNKSVIFEWINVKRLRRIGIGFLIMFIANLFLMLTNYILASKVIELADYTIKRTVFEGDLLLLGMTSFLIAEVFAVGLRLREEQELTI